MREIIYFFCTVFLLNLNVNAQENTEKELIDAINNRETPAWFNNAKLGVFVHWGLYSVSAYGGKESYAEWFLRGLQLKDSLRTNFVKKVY